MKCLLIAQSIFFIQTPLKCAIKKPSVSERGDMDLVNHSVVIWNNGSLCRINSIKKEKLMGTVQYIIKAVIDFINN